MFVSSLHALVEQLDVQAEDMFTFNWSAAREEQAQSTLDFTLERGQWLLSQLLYRSGCLPFVRGCKRAGLFKPLLSEPAPYLTVFAPQERVSGALLSAGCLQLQLLCTNHIVPGVVTYEQLASCAPLQTLNGEELTVERDAAGGVRLRSAGGVVARVLDSGAYTSTGCGVVYVIDGVLLPAPAAQGGRAVAAPPPTPAVVVSGGRQHRATESHATNPMTSPATPTRAASEPAPCDDSGAVNEDCATPGRGGEGQPASKSL